MVYFVIKNRAENIAIMDEEQKEKYLGNLTYLLIFVAFMIFLSGLYILIRALAINANQDIGLYDDSQQNSFESNIAVNYIIDIIEIVLYGIEICFIIRLKREIVTKYPTPAIIQVPKSRDQIINVPRQDPPQQEIMIQQVRVTQQIVNVQNIHPLDAYD